MENSSQEAATVWEKFQKIQYPTAAVLAAADIKNTTLQNWFHRKLVVDDKGNQVDVKDPSTGERFFSFETIMSFAIVKNLTDLGFDVRIAFKVANQFCHTAIDTDGYRRLPALPFASADEDNIFAADTLLAAQGERSLILPYRKDDTTFERLLEYFFPRGFTLIEIIPIFGEVAACLGYQPFGLMNIAYQAKNFKVTDKEIKPMEILNQEAAQGEEEMNDE